MTIERLKRKEEMTSKRVAMEKGERCSTSTLCQSDYLIQLSASPTFPLDVGVVLYSTLNCVRAGLRGSIPEGLM